ncbi:MAG: hypothetical protein NZL89_02215 [Leptospiraceae bacterium]|nr:hypothetical protein [Leptospiraceae bacterium]
MFQHNSCSACCGLFNLPFSEHERRLWLKKNTEEFLALDISQSETIVAFRQGKEKELLPQRIRQDIYVCPFVGIVSGKKIGCLLHPKGSPHPQIQLWPHPQNFSFYGESICLSYDCLVKERMLYRADFFLWAKKADPLHYSRLACDHLLHRALAKIAPTGSDPFLFAFGLALRALSGGDNLV